MQRIHLTIGHKIGSVDALDTATVCDSVTTTLGVRAFTAIPCYGMWEGVPESSTRIEIVTTDDDADRIVSLVSKLAWQLNQDAIMVERMNADARFIASTIPAIA